MNTSEVVNTRILEYLNKTCKKSVRYKASKNIFDKPIKVSINNKYKRLYSYVNSALNVIVSELNDELFFDKPYILKSFNIDNYFEIEFADNPEYRLLKYKKNNNKEDLNIPIKNPNNIAGTSEMEIFVNNTLKTLRDSIAMTLGPYAKTTIVEDRMKRHSITKDGYTVLRSLCFEDDISRTIFEIVLKVSKTLVRKVGDGSTSSIVIAYSLFKNIQDLIKNNEITSKDILDIMTDIASILETEIITNYAKEVPDDMEILKDIASISCNNDKEYGELIKNIFKEIGRYGFINLERSLTDNTYYELKNGYEIPRGYISELMANKADKVSVELENPKVLMIDGVIDEKQLPSLADLLGNASQLGESVVVVASGYSGEASTFFHMNRLNAIRQNNDKLFSVVAIDIATKDKDNRNKFEDLAINLGCKPIRINYGDSLEKYDLVNILNVCGGCDKFKGDDLNSKFIDGKGDPAKKQERIDEILKEMNKITANETTALYDTEIFELRKRMALLKNSMATLYVGGASEQEKDTDIFLLEDAVSACKSTLNYGYIYGGNLVIPKILSNKKFYDKVVLILKEKYFYIDSDYLSGIIDRISKSFKESFISVLMNYNNDYEKSSSILEKCLSENSIYNLKLHRYESLDDTCIVNSCETDIEIMNTAISIIGLVATSNQFVSLNIRK